MSSNSTAAKHTRRDIRRPKSIDEYTPEELSAKFERAWNQMLDGEGRPIEEAYANLRREWDEQKI